MRGYRARVKTVATICLAAILSATSVAIVKTALAAVNLNTTLSMPTNNLGLVGWWTFDGKNLISNVVDSSGTGNTGYLVGFSSTTTTPGIFGQALTFNADYVDISSGSSLSFTGGDFTVSAWAKSNAWNPCCNSFNSIFSHGNNALIFEVDSFDGVTWHFTLGQSGVFNIISGSTALSLGRWYHLTATRSGNTFTLYVNGILDGTTINAVSFTPVGDAFIGRGNGNWNGSIDDARVYNRALSAAEVTRLYNQGAGNHFDTSLNPPNLANGLVGWWNFDGKNLVNNVVDSSGQGNPGYLAGYTSTTTVSGPIGQALRFNGSSQYVTTSFNQQLGDFTACEWVYELSSQPNLGVNPRFVDKQYDTGFWMGISSHNAAQWGGGIMQMLPAAATTMLAGA